MLLCNYFNDMSEAEKTGARAGGGAEDVAALLGEIRSVLGDESIMTVESDDNAFEFPASEVLGLLPQCYLRENENVDRAGESIVLILDNLYEQLARGKVEMPVSQLAYFLPMNIIYQAALDDKSTVTLPLPTVVSAVGKRKLASHTRGTMKAYGIERMDDIFKAADAVSYAGPADEDEDESPVVFMDESEPEQDTEPEEKVAEEKAVAEEKPKGEEKAVEKGSVGVTEVDVFEWPDSFEYPALSVLKLIPAVWLVDDAAEIVGDGNIRITTSDLRDQLKLGRVKMACNFLAIQLPPEVLTEEVSHQTPPEVLLDLKLIVQSIGTDVLRVGAGELTQAYDIDWMADPFDKPDVLPALVRKHKPVKTEELPTAVRSVESLEQREVPYERFDEDGPESEYHELPGNVNINVAAIEELMQLDGMTSDIAKEIIAFRIKHNGFRTIFQLRRIHGIDNDTFEKLTGIKSQGKISHRRKRLVSLLKIPAKRVSDLNRVVGALVAKEWFSAAIISDSEGLVMAQQGLGASGYDLSAVLPRIMHQLQYNLDMAGAGRLATVTLCVDGTYYTFISLSNVILTVLHDENQLTRQGLDLIQKVAEELEWLLSERAYVGPFIR